MPVLADAPEYGFSFSALQRAEIAEISNALKLEVEISPGFSALQRAEIAEIREYDRLSDTRHHQDLVIYHFCTI